MPNAAPRPWRMFLPLAIVLLLALLWSIYWFVASGMAQERMAAERARLSAQGLTVACDREGWGGYPFHFELTCSSPVVTYSGKGELRSQKLLLVALAYAPWQVAALIDGPTVLALPGAAPLEIEHQRILASATLGSSGQPSLSIEAPAVSVPGLGTADKLMAFTRPAAGDSTDIAVQGTGLSYQKYGKPELAADSGNLLGNLQADHTFKIEKFEVIQGPLRYWGSGSVSLDSEHRITGQIDTQTNDAKTLLARVGPILGLSESKLANLRTVLGLLGDGAKAPIIARDGILYLGPFQIAELKPLY